MVMRNALDVSNAICVSCVYVLMRRDMNVLYVRKTMSIKDPPTLYCPFSSSCNVLYLLLNTNIRSHSHSHSYERSLELP